MTQRILIVEDEVDLVSALAYHLERAGYRTRGAYDAAQARQALQGEEGFDLMLLDLMLPDGFGQDLCRWLRQQPERMQLPVIMLTARGSEADRLQSFDNGADDYVTKPFSMCELTARIGAVLRRCGRAQRVPPGDALGSLPAALRRMLERTQGLLSSTASTDSHSQAVRAALSLARAVDARDGYTRRHSEKVAAYAVALGRNLGWRGARLGELHIGGLLHDLGKIGVPDTVLLKRGRLVEDELDAIRRHPGIGAAIIEPIGFAPAIRSIVEHHHEHHNGSGYPRGLAGEAIPTAARIVHLVDAYDAMSSDRVYRRARGGYWIRDELLRYRGFWYDPLLVDRLLELIAAGEFECLRRRAELPEAPGTGDLLLSA